MDILQQAANVWKELSEYRYEFTYGYKKKLHLINLTFSSEDFPHLAGFQYLKDITLSNYNSSRIIDRILEGKISFAKIQKGIQYTKLVEPRLHALIHLKDTLDNEFKLYSYFPQMYPFSTRITADYLIASHIDFSSFVFLIKDSNSGVTKCDFVCCSIFEQGQRNYELNQRPYTLLKKSRIHIPTNTTAVLINKFS